MDDGAGHVMFYISWIIIPIYNGLLDGGQVVATRTELS